MRLQNRYKSAIIIYLLIDAIFILVLAAFLNLFFGGLYLLNNNELHTTLTELRAIAAPAIHGGSWKCRGGYNTPAAIGTAVRLYPAIKVRFFRKTQRKYHQRPNKQHTKSPNVVESYPSKRLPTQIQRCQHILQVTTHQHIVSRFNSDFSTTTNSQSYVSLS